MSTAETRGSLGHGHPHLILEPLSFCLLDAHHPCLVQALAQEVLHYCPMKHFCTWPTPGPPQSSMSLIL